MRNVAVASVVGVVMLLKGCAVSDEQEGGVRPSGYKTERVLLDHDSGTTSRAHCTVVADPFGGTGKVIFGEVVEKGYNKTSYFNRNGFFVVPPAWRGEVIVRYAVRKERSMRVALVSKDGALRSYYFDAPQLEQWCEQFGPVFRLHMGKRRAVVVGDHDLIAAALRDRPDGFRRTTRLEDVWTEMGLLGGVFGANGDTWRRQRRMVMAAFDPGNVRRFYPSLQEVSRRLAGRWGRALALGRSQVAGDLLNSS